MGGSRSARPDPEDPAVHRHDRTGGRRGLRSQYVPLQRLPARPGSGKRLVRRPHLTPSGFRESLDEIAHTPLCTESAIFGRRVHDARSTARSRTRDASSVDT